MKRISCEYNIDTACVEIKYDNGVMCKLRRPTAAGAELNSRGAAVAAARHFSLN